MVQKPNDTPGVTAFSLLVHALSATVDSKAECEFTLSLYDISEKKFISYVVINHFFPFIIKGKKLYEKFYAFINSLNNCSENFIFYWSFSTGNLTNRNSKVLFNVS